MADTQTMIGGQFLTTSVDARDVFTREELTDEQRMFGQTAAEFMRNEVLPNEGRLFAHDWDFVRTLLRKAADLDLLRLEIPEAYGGLGLTKISAAYVGEQIAVSPSFAGSIGSHTSIGTLPTVYFGNDALFLAGMTRPPWRPQMRCRPYFATKTAAIVPSTKRAIAATLTITGSTVRRCVIGGSCVHLRDYIAKRSGPRAKVPQAASAARHSR